MKNRRDEGPERHQGELLGAGEYEGRQVVSKQRNWQWRLIVKGHHAGIYHYMGWIDDHRLFQSLCEYVWGFNQIKDRATKSDPAWQSWRCKECLQRLKKIKKAERRQKDVK